MARKLTEPEQQALIDSILTQCADEKGQFYPNEVANIAIKILAYLVFHGLELEGINSANTMYVNIRNTLDVVVQGRLKQARSDKKVTGKSDKAIIRKGNIV